MRKIFNVIESAADRRSSKMETGDHSKNWESLKSLMSRANKQIVILMLLFAIAAGATAQLKMNANGKIGIGVSSPIYKLDVKGNVRFSLCNESWKDVFFDNNNSWSAPQIYEQYSQLMLGNESYPINVVRTNWFYYKKMYNWSDERLKENIKPLGNTLNKLLEVEGKRYNYKRDSDSIGIPDFNKMLDKETFGFIAQELEEIFPELVLAPSTTNSYYSLDYNGMIPVLVEAIKEQQGQIDSLKMMISNHVSDITTLQRLLDELFMILDACCQSSPAYSPPKSPTGNNGQEENQHGSTSNSASDNGNNMQIASAKLFQNIPNPFSTDTEIRFEIPENTASAKLLIHDMQGAEIKSYSITKRGNGNIIIHASELPAGMYMYTLLVNNTIIDTKKMILTK